jgi:hypothetical protein
MVTNGTSAPADSEMNCWVLGHHATAMSASCLCRSSAKDSGLGWSSSHVRLPCAVGEKKRNVKRRGKVERSHASGERTDSNSSRNAGFILGECRTLPNNS